MPLVNARMSWIRTVALMTISATSRTTSGGSVNDSVP